MITSALTIGDPHAKKGNLPEMDRLFSFIEAKADELKPSHIIILGDLFDNHAVLHLNVIDFWQTTLKRIAKKHKIIALVGNHDQVGDVSSEWVKSSLSTLNGLHENLMTINTPLSLGDWGFIPYTHSVDKFNDACKELLKSGCSTLVCHQTFDGASYDNGLMAPDGFPVKTVTGFKKAIVGHIHTQMEFENIKYLGSPAWNTLSDANKQKGIWHIENDQFNFISTEGVVPKVVEVELTESSPTPTLDPFNSNYVILKGSSKWIAEKSKEFPNCKIVPRPTDSRIVRTASNISSFQGFLEDYQKHNQGIDFSGVLDYIAGL